MLVLQFVGDYIFFDYCWQINCLISYDIIHSLLHYGFCSSIIIFYKSKNTKMIKKILKWLGRTLLIALVGVFAISLGAYLYFDKEDLKQQAIAWVYETTGHKITAGDIYLEFSLIPTFGADNITISESYGDQDFIKAGSVSISLDIIDHHKIH